MRNREIFNALNGLLKQSYDMTSRYDLLLERYLVKITKLNNKIYILKQKLTILSNQNDSLLLQMRTISSNAKPLMQNQIDNNKEFINQLKHELDLANREKDSLIREEKQWLANRTIQAEKEKEEISKESIKLKDLEEEKLKLEIEKIKKEEQERYQRELDRQKNEDNIRLSEEKQRTEIERIKAMQQQATPQTPVQVISVPTEVPSSTPKKNLATKPKQKSQSSSNNKSKKVVDTKSKKKNQVKKKTNSNSEGRKFLLEFD